MKRTLMALVAILGLQVLNAQVTNPVEEKPYIEVNGSAELEIEPDEIYVQIILREKNQNKGRIEVQEDNLLKKMKDSGFDINDLTLSGADGDLQHRIFRKTKVITEKRLQMKLKNAGEVNRFFQILDELEIEDATIAKTSHSKLEELRKQVKIEAMKAAKAKADYLLESIGEQTGKPILIREQNYTTYPGIYGSNAALQEVVVTGYGTTAKARGFEDQLGFTKIKLRFEIFARFGIK